jgi:hypothetical protein
MLRIIVVAALVFECFVLSGRTSPAWGADGADEPQADAPQDYVMGWPDGSLSMTLNLAPGYNAHALLDSADRDIFIECSSPLGNACTFLLAPSIPTGLAYYMRFVTIFANGVVAYDVYVSTGGGFFYGGRLYW